MECRARGLQNVGTSGRRVFSVFLRARKVEGGAHRTGTSCGMVVKPSVVYLKPAVRYPA
jgi:hypothetical protein